MNESDRTAAILSYLNEMTEQFNSGHAIEHAYRPALKALMSTFDDTIAVNDPKHSEHGAPDFVFLKKSHDKMIKGYAEAKDITVSLDKTEKTNQMQRYGGYANLFLTDYLEFRFFRNGEKYETISLGEVKDGSLQLTPENGERLMRELEAFLDQTPEKIRSGKRLAQIMGGKARRIRDNVSEYLTHDDIKSAELSKIYEMMTKLLVHDLEPQKFADMYAQTLVYGLFVARYGDGTPDNFTRSEARDLVPKSNPFLQHFFDHIVGPSFDVRLGYIVDELCEIFSVSNVQEIVHKHLRIQDNTNSAKDPIIHFYEDFLQEYDPSERKKMGAYYTPIPIVKFIVRHVDKILKEEFSVVKGLASSDTIDHWVETGQDMRTDKRQKAKTGYNIKLPRVQVLDPAVGTATFLNETIKFIHEQFKDQEGRWPAYAKDNLVKRLHGFELMMAPYTIAHLKLGMTLKETGVDNLPDRLGIYLTNTLEEGVPMQQDLFSFGLAEAVSQESRYAADIKSNHPIMVVMGNPPYSGESSNNTLYANSLINKYKFEPGGQNKLQERNPKWLNDDYVKFIAFAENMIDKNGSGIVAMITNNGYLDNPTFRGMRWHLAKSFDKIYVLDLHGNAKKNEIAPDGTKDVNVFDIMQGVGIIIATKTSESTELAEIHHAEIYGERKKKFDALNADEPKFTRITLDTKNLYFVPKNTANLDVYELGIPLNELMPTNSVGVVTSADDTLVNKSKDELLEVLNTVRRSSDDKKVVQRLQNVDLDEDKIVEVSYRPFDNRYLYFDTKVVERSRENVMHNFIGHDNVGLVFNRRIETDRRFADIFIADSVMDARRLSLKETNYVAPLYVYHEDNTRAPNFTPAQKQRLENYARQIGSTWKYYEFDESAYKDDRQKFATLIEDKVQSLKQPAIIVFDKIDRFTRDASQREVRIMSNLVEKGSIEIHFPSDNLFITQNSPATDLFRLGIGMLLAKYYSDASRDNVKRRFEQMLNDGIWVHKAPIGYKNVLKGGTSQKPIKDIEVDDTKAHYIVKAFELRAMGRPYAVIAKELGAMGFSSNIANSKAPNKAFLERILNNKFYYGVMVHSGREYKHNYPPLISQALFRECQRVKDERKHEKTKYDSKDYRFKKIVKCGKCGRAVSPFKARNTVYLRCANNKCLNANTAESLILDGVTADVTYVDVPEEWIDQVIAELRNRHDNQQLYFTQNIEQTRNEYDKIKGKMRKIYHDLLDGRITQDMHDEIANELEGRQQELNDRLKLLTSDNKSFQVTASYLLDLAQRSAELFRTSDEALQQKLLEYVLSNIELNDKKLSYILNDPFKTIVETKKKALSGSNSNVWCGATEFT